MADDCCVEIMGKEANRCHEEIPYWVNGCVDTAVGKVPQVSTVWSKQEAKGQLKCRLSNSFRMNYRVEPGLYGVGNANRESPVFISANYKLSFDILRRELHGLDAWILTLDTKGINVWCAAGKGTFGTEELINRIKDVKLEQIVDHRKVVVPQLGAPGIHSHIVKKETGFTISFGPIYARDIKEFINSNYKASSKMRRVQFSFFDRMVLTPMEITMVFKYIGLYVLGVLIFFGLQPDGIIFRNAFNEGYLYILMGLIALFTGAYLTPILLPYIPFRSFAIKGLLMGILGIVLLDLAMDNELINDMYIKISMYLLFPAISSYLALNFTGCTTFTNMSGVVKEMKIAVLLYIAVLIIAAVMLIAYKLDTWGLF